jgi:hypothetical protein
MTLDKEHWRPIVVVDFDCCIHGYESGWKGEDVAFDPPVPGAIEWLHSAVRHLDIHVHGARSATSAGRVCMQVYILGHAHRVFGNAEGSQLVEQLKFPEHKPPAFLTIDDRAITFDGRWASLDPQKLREFRPWPKLTADELEPCPHCGRSGWRQPWR